ncbi:hypothetical protein E4T85_21670, partial [Bacillus stratosphericus]
MKTGRLKARNRFSDGLSAGSTHSTKGFKTLFDPTPKKLQTCHFQSPGKPAAMTATQLLQTLTDIVGTPHIITDPAQTEPYRQGYRFGEGRALAVVRPGTLLE